MEAACRLLYFGASVQVIRFPCCCGTASTLLTGSSSVMMLRIMRCPSRNARSTPAEDDRHDHFVLVLQESTGLVHFEFDVVIARLGSNANFFDFALMDVGLVLFLLLLVFEFAEVHDSTNGRPLIGRHFDQIQIRVPCLL